MGAPKFLSLRPDSFLFCSLFTLFDSSVAVFTQEKMSRVVRRPLSHYGRVILLSETRVIHLFIYLFIESVEVFLVAQG